MSKLPGGGPQVAVAVSMYNVYSSSCSKNVKAHSMDHYVMLRYMIGALTLLTLQFEAMAAIADPIAQVQAAARPACKTCPPSAPPDPPKDRPYVGKALLRPHHHDGVDWMPQCRGCGCCGGPGYRGPDHQCVGFLELDRVCGAAPHLLCKFEDAPGTGLNQQCAIDGTCDVSHGCPLRKTSGREPHHRRHRKHTTQDA